MLILNRWCGERLFIHNPKDDVLIEIVLTEVTGARLARIGINAPAEYRIYREEMLPEALKQKRESE